MQATIKNKEDVFLKLQHLGNHPGRHLGEQPVNIFRSLTPDAVQQEISTEEDFSVDTEVTESQLGGLAFLKCFVYQFEVQNFITFS